MNAALAVAAARDPVAATLAFMGEHRAALLWAKDAQRFYEASFARTAARLLLHDSSTRHAFAACARALRLWSLSREHPPGPSGALTRHVLIALRSLQASAEHFTGPSAVRFQEEAAKLVRELMGTEPATFERDLLALAAGLQRRGLRVSHYLRDGFGAPAPAERDFPVV
jgi:hypothetical protein